MSLEELEARDNPVYRFTPASKETNQDMSTKEIRRQNKIELEKKIKLNKDIAVGIEDKIEQSTKATNELLLQQLKLGFSEITKALKEVVNEVKDDKVKKTRKQMKEYDEEQIEDDNKDENDERQEMIEERMELNDSKDDKQDENEEENEDQDTTIENQEIKNLKRQQNKMKTVINKQQNQINEIMIKIEQIDKDNEKKKETNELKTNEQNEPEKNKVKQRKFKPAENIDLEGNLGQQNITRQDPQPLDFVEVKYSRKKKGPRPNMSETLEEKVSDALEEQKLQYERKRDPNKPDRKQVDMDNETREDKITLMLKRSQEYVGIAPISRNTVNTAMSKMNQRGVFKPQETQNERTQQTIKSLVKSWSETNLDMNDRDWDQINIDSIQQTTSEDSDIVFIKCKTIEDASKITSRAKNLPKTGGRNAPRLVMHVDAKARSRYKAYQNIAKTMRDQPGKNIQTTIRSGKHDYLLRTRIREDNTPWNEIPPVYISKELPPFEIGLYRQQYENELDNKIPDIPEEPNDIEMDKIEKDINSQYEKQENNKRNNSEETENPKTKINRQSDTDTDQDKVTESSTEMTEGIESDYDTEEDSKTTSKILNSTSNNQQNNRMSILTRGLSIPETPEQTNIRTQAIIHDPPPRRNDTPYPQKELLKIKNDIETQDPTMRNKTDKTDKNQTTTSTKSKIPTKKNKKDNSSIKQQNKEVNSAQL